MVVLAAEMTSAPPPARNQQALRWSLMFEELRKYQAARGDCHVPQFYADFPQLGAWVCKQRAQYKLKREGKSSSMTDERIRALEGLGFTWVLRDKMDWNTRFLELRTYCDVHGDCVIPANYRGNPKLGRWVHEQRRQYALQQQGKKSKLTEDRIKQLESIGFNWSSRCILERLWEKRLKELMQFKTQHGHLCVPQRYSANKQLGRFVKTQREQFKLFQKGLPSHLTAKRIQQLDRFQDHQSKNEPKNVMRNERFVSLVVVVLYVNASAAKLYCF